MRIGVFGPPDDPQCQAVRRCAARRGVEVVVLRSDGLQAGEPIAFDEADIIYQQEDVSDLRSFYVRNIPMPHAVPVEHDGELRLHDHWFSLYMQSRERASFYLAWLLRLEQDGALVVNGPQAGSALQLKPHQLHVLRGLGASVPRTLITNDPNAVRQFASTVPEVIYKPLMGGALTRILDSEALERLDMIRISPVIFQERVWGADLRVIVIDGEVVSSVAIETPHQHLDFRSDETYTSGRALYREVELPQHVKTLCVRASAACGLRLAGIDIKNWKDQWVFLELNSSPIYMDVEIKMHHPISQYLTDFLIDGKVNANS